MMLRFENSTNDDLVDLYKELTIEISELEQMVKAEVERRFADKDAQDGCSEEPFLELDSEGSGVYRICRVKDGKTQYFNMFPDSENGTWVDTLGKCSLFNLRG